MEKLSQDAMEELAAKWLLEKFGVAKPHELDNNQIHIDYARVMHEIMTRPNHPAFEGYTVAREKNLVSNPGDNLCSGSTSINPTNEYKSTTGAVRSGDVNHLDFTSMPWPGIRELARYISIAGSESEGYDHINSALKCIAKYIIGDRGEPLLVIAAHHVLKEIESRTGVPNRDDIVSDGDDYVNLPLVGLLTVARTSAEGASKYGRYNYMNGFSIHSLLDHVLAHLFMDAEGDQTEPNLPHAAWGLLVAITMEQTHPELSEPHLLGPDFTITPEVKEELDRNAPVLKAKRDAGELKDAGRWRVDDMPEIKRIREQRGI